MLHICINIFSHFCLIYGCDVNLCSIAAESAACVSAIVVLFECVFMHETSCQRQCCLLIWFDQNHSCLLTCITPPILYMCTNRRFFFNRKWTNITLHAYYRMQTRIFIYLLFSTVTKVLVFWCFFFFVYLKRLSVTKW